MGLILVWLVERRPPKIMLTKKRIRIKVECKFMLFSQASLRLLIRWWNSSDWLLEAFPHGLGYQFGQGDQGGQGGQGGPGGLRKG